VRSTVTSVIGTVHALELAADHEARIVLATSPERVGQGVRCAESLVLEFTKTHKLDVRIVRVASTFGPRMPVDDPHVVMRFILQATRDRNFVLGLERSHRLAYVDDAVDTLVRTLSSELRVPAVAAPFVDASTSAVARAVLEATSRVDAPTLGATSTSAPPLTSPSATTPEALPASIVFGQPSAVELREGVERTVRWFEARFASRTVGPRVRTSGIYGVQQQHSSPVPKTG
jgi:nucleoside-diphosphate-sugar epimerase